MHLPSPEVGRAHVQVCQGLALEEDPSCFTGALLANLRARAFPKAWGREWALCQPQASWWGTCGTGWTMALPGNDPSPVSQGREKLAAHNPWVYFPFFPALLLDRATSTHQFYCSEFRNYYFSFFWKVKWQPEQILGKRSSPVHILRTLIIFNLVWKSIWAAEIQIKFTMIACESWLLLNTPCYMLL